MKSGEIVKYTLPEISDPDKDKIKSVVISLQQTAPFAKLEGNLITFSPTDKDVKSTPYTIKIVLTDEHPFPKTKEYTLSVTINPKPKPVVPVVVPEEKDEPEAPVEKEVPVINNIIAPTPVSQNVAPKPKIIKAVKT